MVASLLVNLAGMPLVALPGLSGIHLEEPSLVSRRSDLAGFSIIADFPSGSGMSLFDVRDDPCADPRRHGSRAKFLADCFPEPAFGAPARS